MNNSIKESFSPKYLSVKEAARYLTVSERNLRERIASREIPFVRFGSRVLFRIVDLDRYVDSKLCV